MASLAVVLIILGCAAYQFFKGTFVRAFATIIIAICGSIAAFGFFEVLANVFISRGGNSRMLSLVPWAQPLTFALLFIVVFGALQTAMTLLTRLPVDLGILPERIGRVVCGIFLGLILSGLLLTALEMAPLSVEYPYTRFDGNRHKKVLLNADGFATGLFSIISRGSFSGKRSFSTIHPDYLDQLYLNRQISGTSILTSRTPAISVPKPAVWPAPESLNEQVSQIVSQLNRQGRLKDESTGKSISMPGTVTSDYQPRIVRVGIMRSALSTKEKINVGTFILSQLRLICKRQGYSTDLTGMGINIYPIGHLKAADQIQVSTEMKLSNSDFKRNAREKWIDFVFCVPRDYVPVLVELKQNSIVEIPPRAIVTADQAPPPEFFTQSSKSKQDNKKP